MEKQDGILRWRGLNTTADRSVLEPGELVLCRNLLARSGALRKRPGLLRLTSESTPRAWPPYVPPLDLPWVTQGDLWLHLVAVPAVAVVGDEWLLRIEAVNRAGKPAAGFATGNLVSLTVEGTDDDGATWTGFDKLVLAEDGNAIDVTAGWVGGVWEKLVTVSELDGQDRLRLTLSYDSQVRDQEELGLEELDSILVELPAGGITPGQAFDVYLSARNAADELLPFFTGTTVSGVWDDGDATELVVTLEDGNAVDLAAGWEDGIWHGRVVLADRGTADVLRLTVSAGDTEAGDDETDIVETFIMVWPAHAQAFQERVLEIRATDCAGARRDDFDGTGYSLLIEGSEDGETWEEWTGLVLTDGGTAPSVTAGWDEGVWRETLRFEDAADFARVRISLLRGDVVAEMVTGTLHPVTEAEVDIPGQVAAGTAFDLVISILDEEGVAVQDFDGSLFALSAHNEDDEAIALTDADSAALDFTEGWSNGVWTGKAMFADAAGGTELHLSATFDGVEIGTATAVIGAAAPGAAHEFAVRLPTGVAEKVEFEVLLVARDAFGALAAEYAGADLVLRWELEDAATGAVVTAAPSLKAGQSLVTGWDGGTWQGSFTLASALAYETLRLVCVLASVDSGEAETPCALVFDLVVPEKVTTGNAFQLSCSAVQADGLPANRFEGEGLSLTLYRLSGGAGTAESSGLNVRVGWTAGYWESVGKAAGAGQVKWVLSHYGEVEDTGLMEIVAGASVGDALPEPPEELPPVSLSLSVPAVVYPGVPFTVGVSADQADYAVEGATLTLTPGMTPSKDLADGWSGGSWEHTGVLADPGTAETMEVVLKWSPGTAEGVAVPEEATAEDFERTASVPIGQVQAVVSLPAEIRVDHTFALSVTVSAGGSRLSGYDGTGYLGLSIEVSADEGETWVAADGALGTLALSPWSNGVLRLMGKLGAGWGTNNRLRAAAVLQTAGIGAWDVAEIVQETDSAGLLKAVWTGPAYLHVYGAAGAVSVAIENQAGTPTAPLPGQLDLQVDGKRDGVWGYLAPLVDDESREPLSFAAGWTDELWQALALLLLADGASSARLTPMQGSTALAALEIAVHEEVTIGLTAPGSVLQNEGFALTLVAEDDYGERLTRYAGQDLLLTGISATVPGAELLDAETDLAPDLADGWNEGVWTREVYITEPCEDFWIRAVEASTQTDLDAAMVEVVDPEEVLLLAVRERQMAAGRTVWAPGSSHTFGQYQAEVNALAPSFVLGTYAGGADAPTMQPGTVADAATVVADLLAPVAAMLVTQRTSTVLGQEHSAGSASGGASLPATKASAEAAWEYVGAGGAGTASYRAAEAWTGSGWVARIEGNGWRQQTTGMSTALAKSVTFYAKHGALEEWDNWSHAGVPAAADVYGLAWTGDGALAATVLSDFMGDRINKPGTTWPAGPQYNNVYNRRGYGAITGNFALVEWTFTGI